MSEKPNLSSLERLFTGLTQNVFHVELGVADSSLTDYLVGLLVRFVRQDKLYKVRTVTGKRIQEVAGMLLEADARISSARREVHRHIGDFALFWTGVYPESLKTMQGEGRRDHFLDYCQQGKRAYSVASMLPGDSEDDKTPALLGRLSHQFELCAYGLNQVRREWENSDDNERPGLIFY